MFNEVLDRVKHRINKQHTWYRAPLELGLKLAMTLRHLAFGTKYSGTWELGTPKGLSKTVLNSEVVLFLRSISM